MAKSYICSECKIMTFQKACPGCHKTFKDEDIVFDPKFEA